MLPISASRKMINVDCGKNGLLSGFHFEFSEGGRWARSKYTCSKAGGAPVVMEPSTLIEPLIQTTEGLCLDGRTPVCWDKLSFKYGDHFLVICIYTATDTGRYICWYIYIYNHIHIHIHTHIHIRIQILNAYTYAYIHTHIYIYKYIYIRICIYIYIY